MFYNLLLLTFVLHREQHDITNKARHKSQPPPCLLLYFCCLMDVYFRLGVFAVGGDLVQELACLLLLFMFGWGECFKKGVRDKSGDEVLPVFPPWSPRSPFSPLSPLSPLWPERGGTTVLVF